MTSEETAEVVGETGKAILRVGSAQVAVKEARELLAERERELERAQDEATRLSEGLMAIGRGATTRRDEEGHLWIDFDTGRCPMRVSREGY